eukprot:170825-Chlamydomonas_euryale.AAC.1
MRLAAELHEDGAAAGTARREGVREATGKGRCLGSAAGGTARREGVREGVRSLRAVDGWIDEEVGNQASKQLLTRWGTGWDSR